MKNNSYRQNLYKLFSVIKNSQNFALTTHKRADGDAFGSTLALKNFIISLNKKADIIYDDQIDLNFNYLKNFDDFLFAKNKINKNYDYLIICDANNLERTGLEKEINSRIPAQNLMIIDHHYGQKNPKDYHLNLVRPEKSATCQIIFDFFKFNNFKIDKDIALCLLTGLYTDTGGFLHANTDSEVLQIASVLMKKGITLSQIAKRTMANKKVNSLKIWGKAMQRTQLNNKKMAYSYITKKDLKDCKASIDDLNGVTNILGAAEESLYSLLLAQSDKNKIKASLRSEDHKNINVSKIAQKFNGGGHPLASGFEIKGKISNKNGKII
ncbi:MAG: hypothetical protein GF335_02675 [Candidatus Moranbacteria bacterium]|nr:hypothetical protein [Candidatus Moranbacteria bacterium]